MKSFIYPNGSARLYVGTRALQLTMPEACELLAAGVEFQFFDGGLFHVEQRGPRDIEKALIVALGLDKPGRSRAHSVRRKQATRVSLVEITRPDGEVISVENLVQWMRREFPEKWKTYYFAAIRGKPFSGHTIKHLKFVMLTLDKDEEQT